MPSAVEILTAMITPAVLISAAGILMMSTSNRFSRVIDRARFLVGEREKIRESGESEEIASKMEAVSQQLDIMSSRAILLRSAMTALYLSIGFFVATSIAIGIFAILGLISSWVPLVIGLMGTIVLFIGSVQLIREARLAFSLMVREMGDTKKKPSLRPRK